MHEQNDRLALLQEIGAVSFCVDDLRLYLDTHPTDAKALNDYNQYANQRKQLLQQYTEKFGPLTSYCPNVESVWQWVVYPAPWEGVC